MYSHDDSLHWAERFRRHAQRAARAGDRANLDTYIDAARNELRGARMMRRGFGAVPGRTQPCNHCGSRAHRRLADSCYCDACAAEA